jgi:hypothetical protein
MTSHQDTLFLWGRRLCFTPQSLQLDKIGICRRHMDDEKPGWRLAGISEGVSDTPRNESPKPRSSNVTLGPHDEFDRPFQNVKALRTLMSMGLRPPVADR